VAQPKKPIMVQHQDLKCQGHWPPKTTPENSGNFPYSTIVPPTPTSPFELTEGAKRSNVKDQSNPPPEPPIPEGYSDPDSNIKENKVDLKECLKTLGLMRALLVSSHEIKQVVERSKNLGANPKVVGSSSSAYTTDDNRYM
jgi:hypothetical protein